MLYVAFSCFVILFEVGYHTIIKALRPVSDYLLHGVIFCLALMALNYVVNFWKDYRAKKVDK